MTATGRHRCPAKRCPRDVDNARLMCPLHWRLVPGPIQRAVLRAYDHGAGLLPNGLPGPELAAAQVAAIRTVNAYLERTPPDA